jgi:hypothetical protein
MDLSSFHPRAGCTDAERRAALRLHDALRERGHEAWVETYWVRPQWAGSLLLHATIGIIASLAATGVPIPAAGVAFLTAISYALEAGGRGGLLKRLFFRRATQVVVVEPEDPEKIALVITARTDAPRGGLLFRVRGRGPTFWLLVVLSLLGVAAAGVARALGAEGPTVGAPQFVPTVFLLLAAAAAMDAGLTAARRDPGAAAADAIELHDRLTREVPGHFSPGLLLAGAGHPFALGLAAHLRRERPAAERTLVLEVADATGATRYSARAGALYLGRLHRQIAAAAEWTAAELPDLEAGGATLRGPSATQVARMRGLPAVAVWGDERVAFASAMVDVLDADLGVQPD